MEIQVVGLIIQQVVGGTHSISQESTFYLSVMRRYREIPYSIH